MPPSTTRFIRCDQVELRPASRTPEGYLRCDGLVARIGIQEYVLPNGAVQREYRPAEEVFSAESLASADGVPFTNTHPGALLDATTAQAHARGMFSSPRQEGDFIAGRIAVYDKGTIDAMLAGRNQLSAGYDCEIDPVPGSFNGQPYDVVQRRIRWNHLAAVDVARAGPEARARLDSAGNVRAQFDNPNPPVIPSHLPQSPEPETHMPQTIRIDGLTFNADEAHAPAIQQAIERAATESQRKLDAAQALSSETQKRIGIIKANAVGLIGSLRSAMAKLDAMKARTMACDECGGTGKVMNDGAEKKCDYCDGKGTVLMHDAMKGAGMVDPDEPDGDELIDADEVLDEDELAVEQATETEAQKAHKDAARAAAKRKRADSIAAEKAKRAASMKRRLDRATRARVAIEVAARSHLGADAKLDGLDEVAIKRLVVAKLAPDAKLDGKGAEYVLARYDSETERAAEKAAGAPSPIDVARSGALSSPPARTDSVGADKARGEWEQSRRDAWKITAAPAAAGK